MLIDAETGLICSDFGVDVLRAQTASNQLQVVLKGAHGPELMRCYPVLTADRLYQHFYRTLQETICASQQKDFKEFEHVYNLLKKIEIDITQEPVFLQKIIKGWYEFFDQYVEAEESETGSTAV